MIDWTEVLVAVATIAIGGTGAAAIRVLAMLATNKKAKNIEAKALDALLEGMALAQDTVVRPAKAKNKGKLSLNLVERAEEVALAKAKSVATGAALKMVKSWSSDTSKSKIKGLLKWGNTAK